MAPEKIVVKLDAPCPEMVDGLDETSFRHFAPLLASSQEYAGHTGFRFREGSFDGIEDFLREISSSSTSSGRLASDANTGTLLAAKLQAAPAVRAFADRLISGEAALVEELERAFRIIVAESARNMMIATVKGLGMFPPRQVPDGIREEDCSYEDVSEPLPVIAQRLYNDHVRRQRDETSSARRQQRRSLTAAFLVDFAYEVGVSLPGIPETYQTLLHEFATRNTEFSEQDLSARVTSERILELGKVDKPDLPAKGDMSTAGWLQQWQTALWGAAGTTAVGEAQKAPTVRKTRHGCA